MEDGPSDRIRTCGILLPKQARYQLRYTRLFSLFIRLVVFTQIKRDTNFATPGYSISAMIPRRAEKIKIFLSVVIYVVKAAFVLLSAIVESPANAGVTRLCGVSPCPVPDTATALPNVARYQLRHTRIGEGGTPPDHGRRTLTISGFLRSCKGEISRSERPSEPPHGR